MQSWLAMLSGSALALGVGILGAGCGKSTGAAIRDAGGNPDVAMASGGVSGGGSAGAAGATASGQSAGATSTNSTTVLGSGGRGGVSSGSDSKMGGAGGAGAAGGTGAGGGGVSGTGGSSRDAGIGDANRETPGAGGSDASTVDPRAFCEMWQTRSAEQDTLDLQRYGFFKASTVLEGTLGDFVEAGSTSYALLSVSRVRAGISRYDGLESAVRIDRPLYDQLGKGAQITLGFGQTHPSLDSAASKPMWEQPQALIAKSSTLAAEVLDFHAWNTPNVAAVRAQEISDGGIKFTLVESLRGDLPSAFVTSLSERWPPLGLSVGSTWIGGFGELITTPAGSTPSVVLRELWPSTSEARALVMTALQSLEPQGFATRYQAELDQLKAEAVRLRLGWMYNQADAVASLEITGIAAECCTGAGGTFHASSVIEMLRGQAPAGQVLTGGHGYYAVKACGDRFLYAMGSSLVLADGLTLDCVGKEALYERAASQVIHELPASADNLALARQWVASAPPLLRLHPAGKDLAAGDFAPPAAIALWSTPISALAALMVGTPTILAIENVSKRAEGYVVRIRTPFYMDELATLAMREVDLAFACADPRLLQTGTRWIGVVLGTGPIRTSSVATPLEQGHLWLAPGLLLPERNDVKRVLRMVPTATIN